MSLGFLVLLPFLGAVATMLLPTRARTARGSACAMSTPSMSMRPESGS